MPKLTPTEQAYYARIGARIRELRYSAKERTISQSQLARGLGVKPNTVSRWESGEYRPTAMDLQAIARLLDVPVGRLFLEDEDRSLTGRINQGLRDLSEKDLLEMLMFIKIRGELNGYEQQRLRDSLDRNIKVIQR
jgi:transcriptional regulator with XRE-family HTH domain